MSTRGGGGGQRKKKKKGRKPAHQNTTAWRHNPKSKKTQKILATPNVGLCFKCHEIIEWRKRYRKYKPLTVPGRCLNCKEKTVCRAYHVLCDPCQKSLQVCAKCRTPKKIVADIITPEEERERERAAQYELDCMTESQRRKYFRELEREQRGAAGELGSDEEESDEMDSDGGEGSDDGDERDGEGRESCGGGDTVVEHSQCGDRGDVDRERDRNVCAVDGDV